jgi:hypothetical protein
VDNRTIGGERIGTVAVGAARFGSGPQPLEQYLDRVEHQFAQRLARGGERRREVSCELRVVEADEKPRSRDKASALAAGPDNYAERS